MTRKLKLLNFQLVTLNSQLVTRKFLITLKLLKSNIKGFNSCHSLEIVKMVSKNFDHSFWLLYRNTFCRTSFLLTALVRYLFCRKVFFFFMNWIGESFNISNFISSRSQVINGINVLQKLCPAFIREHLCWSVF